MITTGKINVMIENILMKTNRNMDKKNIQYNVIIVINMDTLQMNVAAWSNRIYGTTVTSSRRILQ